MLLWRFKNVLHAAHCTGEYSKLIQGMFENYLECKFKDPKMEGVSLLKCEGCEI